MCEWGMRYIVKDSKNGQIPHAYHLGKMLVTLRLLACMGKLLEIYDHLEKYSDHCCTNLIVTCQVQTLLVSP